MSENEQKNLEELLSAYIDGELSERQCNEVRRLIANNEQAAAMLHQLQKNKALLSSLPRAQAPAHLFENVRASLERSVLLDEYHGKGVKAGVVHLFARRLVAAAAMIGLVAALGFVIYGIVKQEAPPKHIIVSTDWKNAPKTVPDKTVVAVAQPAVAFAKMELQLQTDQATAVNAFIYRNIILDNGLENNVVIDRQAQKNSYALSCGRARAQKVLEELGTIWDKFKGSQLSVEGLDMPIVNVTASQAMQIAKASSAEGQIKLAKDFATANNDVTVGPQKEAVAVVDATTKSEVSIIKPALTSGEKKTSPNEPADAEKIDLTIIVTGM